MKNINFIRFGGLSPVKQKAYSSNPTTFHQPPAKHGIYCFPESGIEKFLLGTSTFDNRRMTIIKHPKNDNHNTHWKSKKAIKTFETLFETNKDEAYKFQESNMIPTKHCKPKNFSHTGELWHHLDNYTPNKEIIKRHGSWILTTYNTWLKAYQKSYVNDHTYNSEFKCHLKTSKDHLEVFIERPLC